MNRSPSPRLLVLLCFLLFAQMLPAGPLGDAYYYQPYLRASASALRSSTDDGGALVRPSPYTPPSPKHPAPHQHGGGGSPPAMWWPVAVAPPLAGHAGEPSPAIHTA
uniref:Uncharacterized protein n=1 Tax=Oryza punctata TaxID=4537 RepID=A0A0E0L5A0_ORYPU